MRQLPFLSLLFAFVFSCAVQADELTLLPVTLLRLGGKDPDTFKSGLMDVNKGTVGSNGDIHFHYLICYDLITAVEDLPKLLDAELTLKFAFNKDADTTPAWEVSVAGITETAEANNELCWKLFSASLGKVGEVPKELAPGESHTLKVKELIEEAKLSPVNRYIWFRVQDAQPMNDAKLNTIAGFSNQPKDLPLLLKFSGMQ